MSFIYYCMHCSQKIDVDDSLENKAAVCPTCSKSIFLVRSPQYANTAESVALSPNYPQVQPILSQPVSQPVQQIVCESPAGRGREYKILHEPLADYFSICGMKNLEEKLNALAKQNWRVISSMVVGDPQSGGMVFVLERDNN